VKSSVFLILAMLVALIMQELGVRLILTILGSKDMFFADISWARALEIIVTAILTPVFFSLIRTLERQFGRLGRSRRQAPATW
jgi:cell division protein FtsW (lipid II flippase)